MIQINCYGLRNIRLNLEIIHLTVLEECKNKNAQAKSNRKRTLMKKLIHHNKIYCDMTFNKGMVAAEEINELC